ncbi:MAG: carboxypeptidase-like regulatory domain-containing protein [Candidatus Omnitrophica bacterium]|nr:carboxypeptidase-like regulatory domain-containing protein [Candidatus Omnitrophota bacterium]
MAVTYNTLTDLGYIYTNDGGVFSSNNATNTDFDYFPDDAEVGDILYFGKNGIFDDIQLYIGTAFAATSVTFVWEYWNGYNWVALTVTDGTSNFTNLGQQTVSFVPPINWRKTTINSQNMNWVRVRISAIDTPTEGGANSTQKVKAGDNNIIATGTVTLATIYNADVAGGWGVVENQGQAYRINATLTIGDNSTTTSFTSSNEFLEFIVLAGRVIWLKGSQVTVQFGTLSNGRGYNGSYILFNMIQAGEVGGFRALTGNPTLKFYGTLVNTTYIQYIIYSAALNLYTTDFLNSMGQLHVTLPVNMNYSTIAGGLILENSPTLASNLRLTNLKLRSGGTFSDTVIDTLTFWNNYPNTSIVYMKNCTITTKVYDITSSDRGVTVYYQFSFDLKVIDNAGNEISGATVVMKDKYGTQVFSTTTNENGNITQQWATYEKRVKIITPPQDTQTFYDPHTVTISKDGYQTKTIKYTMDRKREEIEVLEPAVKLLMPMGKRIYKNLKPADGQNKILWEEI